MAKVYSAIDKRDAHALAAARPQRLDIEVRRDSRPPGRTFTLRFRFFGLGSTGSVGPGLTNAGLSAVYRIHPVLVVTRIAAGLGGAMLTRSERPPYTIRMRDAASRIDACGRRPRQIFVAAQESHPDPGHRVTHLHVVQVLESFGVVHIQSVPLPAAIHFLAIR